MWRSENQTWQTSGATIFLSSIVSRLILKTVDSNVVLCFIQTMVSTAAIDHLDFLQAESDVNRYLCYFSIDNYFGWNRGEKKESRHLSRDCTASHPVKSPRPILYSFIGLKEVCKQSFTSLKPCSFYFSLGYSECFWNAVKWFRLQWRSRLCVYILEK